MPQMIAISCLLVASLVALVACGEDENGAGTTTPLASPAATQIDTTPGTASGAQPTSVVAVQTAENTLGFGRAPVTAPPSGTGQGSLILADGGTPDVGPDSVPFDRMAFQFDGSMPGYQVQYVPGPVQSCASGEDEQLTGAAFLEVRLDPAVAHDEQGAPTVSPTELQPGLPTLQHAKQTCDFEGVVVWTFGLSSEVDFRVNTLGGAILVVDMKHP